MSTPQMVKYCPLCSAANDAAEAFCTHCGDGELLGVPPEPLRNGPDTGHLTTELPAAPVPDGAAQPAVMAQPVQAEATPSPGTRRVEQAVAALVLELIERPELRFIVRNGQTVGACRSTRADVELCGVPDLEYISSVHAKLFMRGSQWYVQHLGTTNYIKVDGMKFEKREEVPLNDGSVLVLSKTAFRVIMGGA